MAKSTSTISQNDLYAKSALLMDADSGRILYEKNGFQKMPMASTTKIMTCIYILEHANLKDRITISPLAASQPKVRLGVKIGEVYYLEDLLYALMLESYNDVAVALAEHVSGSVEKFCSSITEKAKDLGCSNTSFKTPNGLDADHHFTTARDLAILTRYALKNKEFIKIINTPSRNIKDLEGKRSHSLTNKDSFLQQFEGAIGVKTGFTGKAGYCFVGAVERENRRFISVVLASGWPPNKQYKWQDTKKLMNYGVDNYEYQQVLSKNKTNTILVKRGLSPSVISRPEKNIKLLLSKKDDVKIITKSLPNLKAPVQKNQLCGFSYIYVNDTLQQIVSLRTTSSVEKINYKYCMEKVFEKFLTSKYFSALSLSDSLSFK